MPYDYRKSRPEQTEEDPRCMAILDFDELQLLRSIHGKLDGYRVIRRERSDGDLDLGLIW